MKMMKKLWNDEAGFVVSAELILIATVAVLGLLVGLAAVRDGIVSELSDVAGAFQDVNQSYSIDGVIGHNANTAGFDYVDNTDECDSNDDAAGAADNCIVFSGPIDEEDATFTADSSADQHLVCTVPHRLFVEPRRGTSARLRGRGFFRFVGARESQCIDVSCCVDPSGQESGVRQLALSRQVQLLAIHEEPCGGKGPAQQEVCNASCNGTLIFSAQGVPK
jgi:hypothetical protein